MEMRSIYEILADLLDYPVEDWRLRCDESVTACQDHHRDTEDTEVAQRRGILLSHVASFASETENLSLSDLQELYTRTFDLSPVCALEIGYHLFGENYKRGVFLANLREAEAPFDLGQEHQLPDYMPVLLRLLTKLDEDELRSALIVDCMIPALEKMLKTLSAGENPYKHLITAVRTVLKSEAGDYRAIMQRAYLPVIDTTDLLRC